LQVHTGTGPFGRRVLTTLLAGLILGLGALFALSATASAADEQGRNYFGAIAVDPATRAYGFWYDVGTRANAESRALRQCRARSSRNTCRGIVWVRNGCAAVYGRVRSDGSLSRLTYATAFRTKNGALAAARNRCGSSCTFFVWTCTSGR
jgi:hypothetical protein